MFVQSDPIHRCPFPLVGWFFSRDHLDASQASLVNMINGMLVSPHNIIPTTELLVTHSHIILLLSHFLWTYIRIIKISQHISIKLLGLYAQNVFLEIPLCWSSWLHMMILPLSQLPGYARRWSCSCCLPLSVVGDPDLAAPALNSLKVVRCWWVFQGLDVVFIRRAPFFSAVSLGLAGPGSEENVKCHQDGLQWGWRRLQRLWFC